MAISKVGMAGMPSVCVVVSSDVAKVQQPAQRYFLQIVHANASVFVTRIECVFLTTVYVQRLFSEATTSKN